MMNDDFCFWIQTSFSDFVCDTIFSHDFKERTSNTKHFERMRQRTFSTRFEDVLNPHHRGAGGWAEEFVKNIKNGDCPQCFHF